MSEIKMKRISLANCEDAEDVFDKGSLAELINQLKLIAGDVPLEDVRIDYLANDERYDEVSFYHLRPETEEERLYRESIEGEYKLRMLKSELEQYERSKKKLTEAGILDPDTGKLIDIDS